MTYKNFFVSILLCIILILAAWTTFLSFKPRVMLDVAPAHVPDAIMEDVSAVIMDKFGKPKMKIATPKLIHYLDNDTTDFILPQVTLYRKSPEPWLITSKFAEATQGVDNVNFYKEVSIHHASDGRSPATVINTARLTVHPNEETAETKDAIILTQPNVKVEAVGMFADMNTGDIKLLSAARGEYVPTTQS